MPNPTSVSSWLAALPEDRRRAMKSLRDVVLANLPRGFEEAFEFGMPSFVVPLSRYATTYNGRPLMLAALGSQKSHMAIYLMAIYADDDLRSWFERAWALAGKKLDAGRSCVRFKRIEDVPLDVIGDAIAKTSVDAFVAAYERARGAAKKPAAKKPAAKKPAAKKPAAKKPAAKKPAAKKPAAKRR